MLFLSLLEIIYVVHKSQSRFSVSGNIIGPGFYIVHAKRHFVILVVDHDEVPMLYDL